MIQALWLKKIWKGRSKGVSSVIGTVFLILIVFAISTNVFLWTISQSSLYNQEVKDVNQKNTDRMNENIVATEGNSTWDSSNKVKVQAKLTNAGSVAAQIINLWVFDTTKQTYNFSNSIASMSESNLNPGQVWNLTGSKAIIVPVPNASPEDSFNAWFVTARGNTVPVTVTPDIIVAQVAQGIGSIAMEFGSFRYHIVSGISLEPAQYSFAIPASSDTVFGLYLVNYDTSRQTINLSSYSCFWLSVPTKNAMASWSIAKVQDNKLVTFDYLLLEYRKPTLVYFGKSKATALAGNAGAANILLYGKIGTSDYGQNIPFISLYLS